MDIYSDLVLEVGEKIQNTSADYKIKIKKFINRRLEKIWHKYLWSEIVVIDDPVSVTAGEIKIALPPSVVGQIIALTQLKTNAVLTSSSPYVFQQKYLTDLANTASPVAYTEAGESTVKGTPATQGVVSIVSTSTADTSQYVRIWGMYIPPGQSAGPILTEKVQLTGTTSVNSVNEYTTVNKLTKNAITTGAIVITAGAVSLANINPTEFVTRYKFIKLNKIAPSDLTLYLTYKRKFIRLINDEDVPDIDCGGLLVIGAYADCLKEQRQFSKAREVETEYKDELLSRIMEQETQGDKTQLMTPHIERSDIDEPLIY